MEVAEVGVVAIWVVRAAISKVHARVGSLQVRACRLGRVAAVHQQLQRTPLCETSHKSFMTLKRLVVVGGGLASQTAVLCHLTSMSCSAMLLHLAKGFRLVWHQAPDVGGEVDGQVEPGAGQSPHDHDLVVTSHELRPVAHS